MDQLLQTRAVNSFEDIILSYTTPRTEKDALISFIILAFLCVAALGFFFLVVCMLHLIITHEPTALDELRENGGHEGHFINIYYTIIVLFLAWGALVLLHYQYLNLSVFQDDLGTWHFRLSSFRSIVEYGGFSWKLL